MTAPSHNAIQQTHTLEMLLHEHMALYGYDLIDLPTIENADTFLTRAGAGIIERLFTFERGDTLLALRPEFTAVAAQRYVQEAENAIARWQMSGHIFEDVSSLSNGTHQFQQHTIGAECIGAAGTIYDAEIIAMAAKGINALGLSEWELVIGHVGLQLHLLTHYNLDKRTYRLLLTQRDRLKREGVTAVVDYLTDLLAFDESSESTTEASHDTTQTKHMLDALLDSTRYGSTMGGRSRRDIAGRMLEKHKRGMDRENITAALEFLAVWGKLDGTPSEILPKVKNLIDDSDTEGLRLFDAWEQTIEWLVAYGIPESTIVLQPDLTRNWDYYTGMVFGIRMNDSYLASGGRYDGLTKLLGSDDAFPAVGFAYYTNNILPLLEPPTVPLMLTLSTADNSHAIKWMSALRDAHIAIKHVPENGEIHVTSTNEATYNGQLFDIPQLIEELTS